MHDVLHKYSKQGYFKYAKVLSAAELLDVESISMRHG
jgi:hypothetical protein